MADRPTLGGYLHIEGWDSFEQSVFDRRRVRAGFRKAGRIVAAEAEMAIRLARGAEGYPINRTGALVKSIKAKVSRAGFLVKIAPMRTEEMGAHYYPAYLHYGVRAGAKVGALAAGKGRGTSNRRAAGARQAAIAQRRASGWRIAPRENYMVNALEDAGPRVRAVLQKAFAAAFQ